MSIHHSFTVPKMLSLQLAGGAWLSSRRLSCCCNTCAADLPTVPAVALARAL